MVRDYRIFEGTQGSGGKGSIGAGLDLDDDDDGIYWNSETVTPTHTHIWVELLCFCTTLLFEGYSSPGRHKSD